MSAPVVSVVMGVFNGEDTLAQTLESILSQEGCDLEFIIVNDGSRDGTPALLEAWAAKDSRLRIIHQANGGLTRSLIRGCSLAQGAFIARQDAGDISLPGRLQAQAQRLRQDAHCVAVTCHTEFVGPKQEPLYKSQLAEAALNRGIRDAHEGLAGPSHHGSVMMRADNYRQVGGYRAAFYYAQDLDLWTRLAEHGQFGVIDDVLYRARLDPASISGTRSREQNQLKTLIAQAILARRANATESTLLQQAASIVPGAKTDMGTRLAQGNYFIGSCLRLGNAASATPYFEQAVRLDPWHWRARLRLVLAKAGF